MAAPAFDGFAGIRGVWGGNPDYVPAGYSQNASNRFFREDENKTRPSIKSIELTFENEQEKIWFEGANGQGAFWYAGYPSNLYPKAICSIGGRIFTIEIVGRTGKVTRLFDGNYRQGLHAWFVQGFEYLVVQDGVNAPMIWDGQNPPYRSDLNKNQVPIGSVMAFIHGRFVLATADGLNNIRLSEIAGATDVTKHDDILTFPTALATYGIAANLGEVQGLFPMSYLDSGTGQYELVALCKNGATSFDFRGQEETFFGQIQKISLIGTGCVGSHAFAGLNGDLFFRTPSGINTYRNSRLEFTQSWDQTPISREVNYWIRNDRADLLETIPMVGWQNMVLTGCSPLIELPSNRCFGYHRYCRGFTVFDAQNMSTAGRDGRPVWHGAWTGIRPWAFVEGRIGTAQRCFAFSFDRDKKNRLYEITLQDGDDYLAQEPRSIEGFFTSATLGTVEARTNTFQPKRINGGVIELQSILGASQVWVEYRPDGSPCWIPVDSMQPGCDCPTPGPCYQTSWPPWARKNLEQVSFSKCIPGTSIPANRFHHAQVRIRNKGSLTVSRFNIRMDLQEDSELAECLKNNCNPIECCPSTYDYSYHIAPIAPVNTAVPALDCTPLPVTYTSTRYYRMQCPNFPSQFVIATGQATSSISQADADQKAMAQAQSNAEQTLNCPNCSPDRLVSFTIDGGTMDLSEYFVSGQYGGAVGQPIRLYDNPLGEYVATGIVNDSGTLTMQATFPQFTHGTYDIPTNTYTDGGGGPTTLSLDIGCNIGGAIVWPDGGGY